MELDYKNLINEWQLISGKDIKINDNIIIKHLSVQEVLEFGEENYLKAISIFITTPYDYMVELYDAGKLYTEMTNWELFVDLLNANAYKKSYKKIIGDYDFIPLKKEDGEIILYCPEYNFYMDELIYQKISIYLKTINDISLKNPYNPSKENGFKTALIKALVEDERYKRKRRKNIQQNKKNILLDYVTKLVWKTGRSYSEILNMTLYQFRLGIKTLSNIKNYEEIKLAYFTGNCNSKEVNITSYDWLHKSL